MSAAEAFVWEELQGNAYANTICCAVLRCDMLLTHVYATSFSSRNFAKLMTADKWRRSRADSGLWMSCSAPSHKQWVSVPTIQDSLRFMPGLLLGFRCVIFVNTS